MSRMGFMQMLPLEVLSHIMNYLDFASRREAALVCHTWYEASIDPVFMKTTKYTFDVSLLEDEDNFSIKRILHGCLCKSPNLHITGLDENFNAKLFLKLQDSGMAILGPHVVHLSLKNSNILERTLAGILCHCENIESLDLTGCNTLFMSGEVFKCSERTTSMKACLKNIKALNLSSIRYLNDAILSRLASLCPSLESITMNSNTLSSSSIANSRSNLLTFSNIHHTISLQAAGITHIDFSHTSILSSALSSLSTIRNLQLRSVVLQYCRELTDEGVINLVRCQKTVTLLDLTGSSEIGNGTVSAVCTHLNNLQTLKLRKCQKVTSASVSHLYQLENLVELDLSECFDISMNSLQNGIRGMRKLKNLQLKCCNLTKFGEYFFGSLPPFHNNKHGFTSSNITHFTEVGTSISKPVNEVLFTKALCYLDVGSSQYVDDLALQAINVHLTNLEVLKLSWCGSITNRGILGFEIIEKTHFQQKKQEHLESYDAQISEFLSSGKYSNSHGHAGLMGIPGSEFVTDKIILDDVKLANCMEKRGLARLKHLKQLSLSNCKKLSEAGVLLLFQYKCGPFKHLESLDLGMLHHAVTDDTLKAISCAGRLRSLSLAFCGKVTDAGIQYLSKHLRSLDTLNLSNCDSISNRSLRALSVNCVWLKELDISMCGRISVKTVNELSSMLHSLLRLHTRYTGGASLDKTL
ncbi:uncharacterized protein LOC143448681 [Clavelina lepadiformis]|uniref:uncharacterized protein LOC143448681 n=1 Tax=Clavelina lepadiformis TaxID=159417 RepID=UPI004043362C